MRKLFLLFLSLLPAFAFAQNNARMLSAPNAQTGTSYIFVAQDATRLTTFQNAGAVAVTLASGVTPGFGAGTLFSVQNLGPGTVTITCTTCLIFSNGASGSATFQLSAGQGADIYGGGPLSAANYAAFTGGASAASSPPASFDNCVSDQTGNAFYNVTSLSNYFLGSWAFVFNTSTYITCTIFIPAAQTGATIVLDIAANDATAGHTANFQTCDQVINSGTVNIGALTCAANQAFTTTTTAYNRVTLTFNVQSTLANNSVLVVKIATSTTGTPPTANMLVYPHFIL